MKQITASFASAFSVLLLLVSIVAAQQKAQDTLIVSLPQGGFAALKVETISSAQNNSSHDNWISSLRQDVVLDDENVLHRLLVDQEGNVVFAYDLAVRWYGLQGKFVVSARPVSRRFEAQLKQQKNSCRERANRCPEITTLIMSTPAEQVSDGETVALDLLVNETTGNKVIDYLKVALDKSRLNPKPSPTIPKEFAIANVELSIRNYKLRINDELVQVRGALKECKGPLVWLYMAGVGRFVFSLVPYEGYDFRRIGVVEANRISFTWRSTRYEWISSEPILSSRGAWYLWVLHDPNYLDVSTLPSPGTTDRAKAPGPIAFPKPWPWGVVFDKPEKQGQGAHSPKTAKPPPPLRVLIGGEADLKALFPKE